MQVYLAKATQLLDPTSTTERQIQIIDRLSKLSFRSRIQTNYIRDHSVGHMNNLVTLFIGRLVVYRKTHTWGSDHIAETKK